MDFHRRIADAKDDKVPTLCGQIVNYQEACGSLTNVGCPRCIAAADIMIEYCVKEAKAFVDLILAKPTAGQAS